jgi:hypothetical protein
MASIWVQKHSEKHAQKIKGNLHPRSAMHAFEAYLVFWAKGTKGNKHKRVYGHEALLYDANGLVGLLFVEFMSPPTAPEMGQPNIRTVKPERAL